MWCLQAGAGRPNVRAGVQAGRRFSQADVHRVAAVLLRRVAHVERGGLNTTAAHIPSHLRLVARELRAARMRFASRRVDESQRRGGGITGHAQAHTLGTPSVLVTVGMLALAS